MSKYFCPICKSSSFPYYSFLVKCNNCGVVFFKDDISKDELSNLYNKSGYFFGTEYMDYIKEKNALQKNFLNRIKYLRRLYPVKGKLFEIGCAYGFFLELAQNYWQVKGIDISEDACMYAKNILGLDVICDDFLNYKMEDNYDIFCLWDTIEHLKCPHLYIQKISKNIKPNGLLCITTGDIQSLVARFRKEKWRMIHPPTHLFYFSRQSLSFLLNSFGFKIVHYSKCGNYRNLNAMVNGILLSIYNKKIKTSLFLQKIIKINFSKDIDIKINLFDIMFLVAQKVSNPII